MKRTKLDNRTLPNYTRGEETFNMVTHIVGGGIGIVACVVCVVAAAFHGNTWGVVSSAIYGAAMIMLFTMSSIYHGLAAGTAKKVFQVLDHCTIFILIAGTYTPILLNKFRLIYPAEAWTYFGIVWGLAILGIVLNSIDLKRFKVFSMANYLGMGWLCIMSYQKLVNVLGFGFFIFLITGGVLYTLGAAFYIVGKRKHIKYMHSVFHIFVDAAALLHFLGILLYILPA